MIKLKDILAESTNIKLHTVITDKTEPAFITEEQWNEKWAIGKCAITENIITEADEKEAKKVIKKNISFLKRVVIKYAARTSKGIGTLPKEEVQRIAYNYLKTGKMDKRDMVKIYTDVRAALIGVGTAAPVIAAMLATMSFMSFIIAPIAFAVMAHLTSQGDFLSKFMPRNVTDDEIIKLDKLVTKRYTGAKAKAGAFKSVV